MHSDGNPVLITGNLQKTVISMGIESLTKCTGKQPVIEAKFGHRQK